MTMSLRSSRSTDTCTAERTRMFGALTWLRRVAVPLVEKGVEVEMETTRPVFA
jgi:hypothetical protein